MPPKSKFLIGVVFIFCALLTTLTFTNLSTPKKQKKNSDFDLDQGLSTLPKIQTLLLPKPRNNMCIYIYILLLLIGVACESYVIKF